MSGRPSPLRSLQSLAVTVSPLEKLPLALHEPFSETLPALPADSASDGYAVDWEDDSASFDVLGNWKYCPMEYALASKLAPMSSPVLLDFPLESAPSTA